MYSINSEDRTTASRCRLTLGCEICVRLSQVVKDLQGAGRLRKDRRFLKAGPRAGLETVAKGSRC